MNINKLIGKTKGIYTIIKVEEKELNKPNKKDIKVTCKCTICGSISKIRLERFYVKAPYAEHFCHNCRRDYYRKITERKLINKTFGVLKVISFSRWEDKHQIYKCKCLRCGSFTEVRADRLNSSTYQAQSCTHCYHQLLGVKTKERFENKYGLKGEQYEKAKLIQNKIYKCKANAKIRSLKFLLTDDEAKDIMSKPCYYCGDTENIGLDRIDSTKDYELNNVVPCCGVCNIMKNAFTKEVFFDKISKIYNIHCIKSSTTIENPSKDGSE